MQSRDVLFSSETHGNDESLMINHINFINWIQYIGRQEEFDVRKMY